MSPRNEENNKMIRDEREQQILMTALKIFVKEGYSAAKISDIAAASGLSHGLIYHYFKSKAQIFTALIKTGTQDAHGAMAFIEQAQGSAWERLYTMIDLMLKDIPVSESAYMYALVYQAVNVNSVPKEAKRLARENYERALDCHMRLVIEGQREGQFAKGDPKILVMTLLSAIQGLALFRIAADEFIPLPTPDIVMRLLKA